MEVNKKLQRTVLITGCTSGFGKLLVNEFLKNGDYVVATGRNLTQRKEVFEIERKKFASHLIEMNLDVTVSQQVDEVVRSLGQLDILINNAGYGLFGALEDTSIEQIRHQMEVNFFGTAMVIQKALPLLRASRGKVFNFSSGFGIVGFPLTSVYCASKFAVEGLSESLGYELSPHNVQVCIVEPGAYRTSFGSKLVWGKDSLNKESAYSLQTTNYQKLRDKLVSRPNPPQPIEVAAKVCELSRRESLPLRVRLGKDTKSTYLLKRLIPGQVFFKMTNKVYRKMFLKKDLQVEQ